MQIADATEKSNITFPNTASKGQDVIREEVKDLKEQFEICFSTTEETQSQLGESLRNGLE